MTPVRRSPRTNDADARVDALATEADEAARTGDVDREFATRVRLVEATYFAAASTRTQISSFLWCLARHDSEPERFPLALWSFKWVASAAAEHVTISLEQVDSIVDDLCRRFVLQGSVKAADKVRFLASETTGRSDADILLEQWLRQPRSGALNDCVACDTATHVVALTLRGRGEEALHVASPLLGGRQRCGDQPHFTLPRLLKAARRHWPEHDYRQLRSRTLALIDNDPKYLSVVGDVVADTALAGDLDEAIALIERHRDNLDRPYTDDARLWFCGGAFAAVQVCQREGVAAPEAVIELSAMARELAVRFDERNGNQSVTTRLKQMATDEAVPRIE